MILRTRIASAVLLLSALSTSAQKPPEPDLKALVAQNTHSFTFGGGKLAGAGATLLTAKTRGAQFVMFGESHDDYDTPIFAGAVFDMLRREHGFGVLVVEQDPLAMESVNAAPLRGDLERIAALARKYPTHFEFDSDQDLGLLADVGKIKGLSIWGLEQSLGPARYLEELEPLAPNEEVRSVVSALAEEARTKEATRPQYGKFMHDDPTVLARLRELQKTFGAKAGSRAEELLGNLTGSVEIFSFNRRAGEGEPVGLYNNTEREALFKRHFMKNYRQAQKNGVALPKAFFKFGAWHMYRGKSPGSAYTIANFAHEFAISNGMEGYGMMVLAPHADERWEELDAWMRPILPAARPEGPVLIDLRPLKPYQRKLVPLVVEKDQWLLRDTLQGFDAIVILPNSRKATHELTAR